MTELFESFIYITLLLVISVMIEFFKSSPEEETEDTRGEVTKAENGKYMNRRMIPREDLAKFPDLFRGNTPISEEKQSLDEIPRQKDLGAVTRDVPLPPKKVTPKRPQPKPKTKVSGLDKFRPLFAEKDETEKLIINTHTIYMIRNLSVQEVAKIYRVT